MFAHLLISGKENNCKIIEEIEFASCFNDMITNFEQKIKPRTRIEVTHDRLIGIDTNHEQIIMVFKEI